MLVFFVCLSTLHWQTQFIVSLHYYYYCLPYIYRIDVVLGLIKLNVKNYMVTNEHDLMKLI